MSYIADLNAPPHKPRVNASLDQIWRLASGSVATKLDPSDAVQHRFYVIFPPVRC